MTHLKSGQKHHLNSLTDVKNSFPKIPIPLTCKTASKLKTREYDLNIQARVTCALL